MDLNIKTKFDVGQTVYKCKPDTHFVDGKYVTEWIEDETPYVVNSVRLHIHEDRISIYYRLDGFPKSFKEKHLYSSLEEIK